MKFDIITIFPAIFNSYFGESILKRAVEAGKIDIEVYNLRDFTSDKHKTTDDIPYGGGAGMVMKIEPIWKCIQSLTNNRRPTTDNDPQCISKDQRPITDSLPIMQNHKNLNLSGVGGRGSNVHIILFSAKGKLFTQRDAERLSKYDRLIMICGRYEGVDERVADYIADEEFSIGEYVLTGGEIPAMVVVDSVSRLMPGVLGNEESLREESFGDKRVEEGLFTSSGNPEKEYPHYTRPEEFNGWKVPRVLLSGNHKEIEEWRIKKRSNGE